MSQTLTLEAGMLTAKQAAAFLGVPVKSRAMVRALTPMPHAALIARVADKHRALTRDFHRNVWEIVRFMGADYIDENRLDYAWFKRIMPLTPEAYRFDLCRRKLVIYEVEVTSRLTPRKMEILGSFCVHMTIMGWAFTLIRVDEYGRHRKETLEPFIAAGYRAAQA